jgi:hypothetical protein
MNAEMKWNRDRRNAGYVAELALRILLLGLVLGQVVFLAGRMRMRVDVTADALFTLTGTSKSLLGGLDDQLRIECYFCSDDAVPAMYGDSRKTLKNVLDEYVQSGGGRVLVTYHDPLEDKTTKEKATNLRMQPQTLEDPSRGALALKEVWQGMRIMYGADKQKVIPFLGFSEVTFAYEKVLTPMIKELTVAVKPKIGLISYKTEAMGEGPMASFQQTTRVPSVGYTRLPEFVKGRYEVTEIDWSGGQLIDEEIDTLLIMRPKGLSDRQKYVLDQFLMRGGKAVIFCDTVEYPIGQARMMTKMAVGYDAESSKEHFLDQLKYYGVAVDERVIADGLRDSWEPFAIQVMTQMGPAMMQLEFPYWIKALPVDYAKQAAQIAMMTQQASNPEAGPGEPPDPALIEQYQKVFEPGVDSEHTLLKAMSAMPSMYWVCPVDLAAKIPDGVVGKVLMRSSPLAFAEEPANDMRPYGASSDPNAQRVAMAQFDQRWKTMLASSPRRQFGLMVQLDGSFKSFFEGKEIPKSKAQLDAIEAAKPKEPVKDPLDEPISSDPLKTGDEKTGDEKDAKVQGPPSPPAQDGGQDAAKEEDPDQLLIAPPDARLVVLGDSDFLRDDMLTGAYAQAGGPYSPHAGNFYVNLLDWLAEDEDLMALTGKMPVARKIDYAGVDSFGAMGQADIAELEEAIKDRQWWMKSMAVGLPILLILFLWVVITLGRRTRKQQFLSSVGGA